MIWAIASSEICGFVDFTGSLFALPGFEPLGGGAIAVADGAIARPVAGNAPFC